MPALSAPSARSRIATGRAPAATSRVPELLAELAAAVQELHRLHAEIDLRVIRARAHGATWRPLGTALGMTHQGARRRYAR